jgi:nucleotide-binding universal stress UspA family protein
MDARVRKVVVGVDGTEPSMAALRWAFGEAARTRADLEVVCAWFYPRRSEQFVLGGPKVVETAAAQAADTVARMVRAVREAHPDADVTVHEVSTAGPPATALLRRAEDADLLVVGSRRRGLRTLLLGSVSQQCVGHAQCPVVVVHPDRASPDGVPSGSTTDAGSVAADERAARPWSVPAGWATLGSAPAVDPPATGGARRA